MIPQTLTLADGTEITVSEHPELRSQLEAAERDSQAEAATREKNKLYPIIEEYRKQISPVAESINKVVREVQTSQQFPVAGPGSNPIGNSSTPTKPVTIQEAKAQAQAGSNKDAEATASAVLGDKQAMKEVLGDIFHENISPLIKRMDNFEKRDLDTYRNKIISENQGSIIAELVQGNTVEELDASLNRAKESYKQYFPETPAPNVPPVPQGSTTPPPSPTPNPVPAPQVVPTQQAVPPTISMPGTQTPTESVPAPDYKNMSDAEFAKRRESGLAILAQKV